MMTDRRRVVEATGRRHVSLQDGVVLVFSDCHYWPGPRSTAHRALVHFAKKLKPTILIANGDVLDACTISRHPPIGWEHMPSVKEELEVCQERLSEISKAAPQAQKIWNLGNHDGRYATKLAQVAPEFKNVHGTSLNDHFPDWKSAWSVHINLDTVIKHRGAGGAHAAYNNTIKAGVSMITGHLHSQKVTPFSDYRGVRFGVDTGCIADPYHEAFQNYTEDSSKDWRSGFCALTFHNGCLLPPELVTVWDETHVYFRGALHEV